MKNMLSRVVPKFPKLAHFVIDVIRQKKMAIDLTGGVTLGLATCSLYTIHNNVKHRDSIQWYSRSDSFYYPHMSVVGEDLTRSFILFYPPVTVPLANLFGVTMLTSKGQK